MGPPQSGLPCPLRPDRMASTRCDLCATPACAACSLERADGRTLCRACGGKRGLLLPWGPKQNSLYRTALRVAFSPRRSLSMARTDGSLLRSLVFILILWTEAGVALRLLGHFLPLLFGRDIPAPIQVTRDFSDECLRSGPIFFLLVYFVSPFLDRLLFFLLRVPADGRRILWATSFVTAPFILALPLVVWTLGLFVVVARNLKTIYLGPLALLGGSVPLMVWFFALLPWCAPSR